MSAAHVFASIRRPGRLLVGWVLAWFALSCLAAVAAPVMQPQGSTLVCTSAGEVRWVNTGPTGSATDATADLGTGMAAGHHTLECVLCLPMLAPPNTSQAPLALSRISEPRIAHFSTLIPSIGYAKPVARGPPTLL